MRSLPNSVWLNLGQRIADFRRSKGISQLSLAEMADISKEHLSNLERGNKLPSAKTLARIASALDVSLDTLVGVDNVKSHTEIDAQLQSLLNTYTIAEKDALLAIFRDIERFSTIVKAK
ncbi:MAG: helix-turn-helix transcriptional regulator [Clostridia bacterium]|nr:helix-turn-helix transcriptional regulator [Clostridia bacterium]